MSLVGERNVGPDKKTCRPEGSIRGILQLAQPLATSAQTTRAMHNCPALERDPSMLASIAILLDACVAGNPSLCTAENFPVRGKRTTP